jgi:hypothetical protein
MSPNNKSKRRSSKRGRGRSRSKAPSRGSTSPRETASGPDEKRCGESGNGENKRARQGGRGTPGEPEGKKPQRRHRLKKRVPIGEALRREGLDERTIAGTYAQVVDNLKGTKKAGSNEKLLVEILKECTRQIEAAQPVGDGAVQVQLVHRVERPARANPKDAATPQDPE